MRHAHPHPFNGEDPTIYKIINNVSRNDTEENQYINHIYLTSAKDIEHGQFDGINNPQPVDVRGLIDHRYNHTDNLYGCLKISLEIEDALRNNKSPIVFCDAGLERSPLAIAVWFSWTHDVSLDFAYKHVKSAQPAIHRRDEWVQRKGNRI